MSITATLAFTNWPRVPESALLPSLRRLWRAFLRRRAARRDARIAARGLRALPDCDLRDLGLSRMHVSPTSYGRIGLPRE